MFKKFVMDAYIIKNEKGLYNIIANNDGWFIWDSNLPDPFPTVMKAVCSGLFLIPAPENIPNEFLKAIEVSGLPDERIKFTSHEYTVVVYYMERFFPNDKIPRPN